MRARFVLVLLFLSAVAVAQSGGSCPAGRPIDDILAEMHKQQSKKNSRNKNPLPENICIFGWCRTVNLPHPSPGPGKRAGAPPDRPANPTTTDSTSRTAQDECLEAMDRALDAAHNVEVGDYYFEQKNYRAAAMRYQDADTAKPDDAAIHVRLGRAFEKLNDVAKAIENYKAAEKLGTPEKWFQEATAALARLQK